MQVLNFASFKVQKTANERASQEGVTRGQGFNLKFRKFLSNKNNTKKIESGYTISDKKFAELGLSEHGIVQLVGENNAAFIAVVNNEDATMLKRTDKLKADAEKGKKFKSTILDKALMASGVIEDKEGVTQMLDLEKVEGAPTEIDGLTIHALYAIVKGEDTRSQEEKDSEADTDATDSDSPSDNEPTAADLATANSPQASADEDEF